MRNLFLRCRFRLSVHQRVKIKFNLAWWLCLYHVQYHLRIPEWYHNMQIFSSKFIFFRIFCLFLWHWKNIILAKHATLLLFCSSKAAKNGSMWHSMVDTWLLNDFKCSCMNKIYYMTIFWPHGPEIDIFSSFDEYSAS